MAAQNHSTDDQLRVLVYSDPLSDIDEQDIRQYLTIALQLRYPTRRVVVDLYSSLQSYGLNGRIEGVAQQVEDLAANKLSLYDWCLPFFFLQTERSIDGRHAGDQWPLLCEQIATEADTIANHILLAIVPYSDPKNRDFLDQVNEHIVKLANTGARYLLDLDPLFSKVPSPTPGYANICCICDVVAKFIAGHQLGFDKSEDEVLDTLVVSQIDHIDPYAGEAGFINESEDDVFDTLVVSQLDHIDPNAGEAEYRHSKPFGRARKYYRHGYTEAQLTDLRKTLEQRCVQHLETIQNIHNSSKTPKAKRTQTQGQTANMRITRPDRVHAETFIGSSTTQSKDHEGEWTKKNWPQTNSGGSMRTDQYCPVFPSIPNSVSASDALNLRKPSKSDGRYLIPNSTNKRTHEEAFNEIEPSSGELTALLCLGLSASIPRPPIPLAVATVPAKRRDSDLWPKPDLSHPAFSVSYQTGERCHKEKRKKGKMIVLKYTRKAKRVALAIPSSSNAQYRGSSLSLHESSMLGCEQEHDKKSSRPTSMEGQEMDEESPDPPRPQLMSKRLPPNSDRSANYIIDANVRVYTNPLQRQVSEAALQAPFEEPRRTGKLSNNPRGDAGSLANPSGLASLDAIPDFMFDPGYTAADVIRSLEEDLEHNNAFINSVARHVAQLTGTINPAALVTMTAEDIIEAHLPVLKGYQNVYPDIFKAPAALAAQNPLALPILQVNGRMRRDSIPNPLSLSGYIPLPGDYHNPYQSSPFAAGSDHRQTQLVSPTPAPKVGLLSDATLGMLAPPPQSHISLPISADFMSKLHDDLRTMRDSPEPQNNSAHLSVPLSRTPSGPTGHLQLQSPIFHGLAKMDSHHSTQADAPPQFSPQLSFGPNLQLQAVPFNVRQEWMQEAEKNAKGGKCSFCGLAKDDPKCRHAIPNRPEPVKAEGEDSQMPDASTRGDQAQDIPSQKVQLQSSSTPIQHQHKEPTPPPHKETPERPKGRKNNPKPTIPEPDPEQIAHNLKLAERVNGRRMTSVSQKVENQAQTKVDGDAQMLDAQDAAQRETSATSGVPPSNDESVEEDSVFGASNAELRAQWQAHAQLPTPFMLLKVARKQSEKLYKMDCNSHISSLF